MPYNSETETFYQAPATVVDSTPDGDTVQEGFDDRLTPAMAGLYADLNLLKADGMISVGIPATTTARGIGRVATAADAAVGSTITNGPAFLDAATWKISATPAAGIIPLADGNGKLDRWCGTPSRLFASFNTTEPDGLLCNGGAYSRTTYAALFAVLGTAFGVGDGSTTFNIPDFRGRTMQGANGNLKAVLAAGLPDVSGDTGLNTSAINLSGPFYPGSSNAGINGSSVGTAVGVEFALSRANSIYGASTTVQPPAIAVNIFIKY